MDCRCQAGKSSRAHRDVSCAYLTCVSFTPCFTQIVTRARDEASNYRLTYSQPIPLKVSQVSSWDEVNIYLYSSLPPLLPAHIHTHTSIWQIECPAMCMYLLYTMEPDRLAAVSCLVLMDQKDHVFTWQTPPESHGWGYTLLYYATSSTCSIMCCHDNKDVNIPLCFVGSFWLCSGQS